MVITGMVQQITNMMITFDCIIDPIDPFGYIIYPNLHLILHNTIIIGFFSLTQYTSFRTVYLLSFLSWQSNLVSSWNIIIHDITVQPSRNSIIIAVILI